MQSSRDLGFVLLQLESNVFGGFSVFHSNKPSFSCFGCLALYTWRHWTLAETLFKIQLFYNRCQPFKPKAVKNVFCWDINQNQCRFWKTSYATLSRRNWIVRSYVFLTNFSRVRAQCWRNKKNSQLFLLFQDCALVPRGSPLATRSRHSRFFCDHSTTTVLEEK